MNSDFTDTANLSTVGTYTVRVLALICRLIQLFIHVGHSTA